MFNLDTSSASTVDKPDCHQFDDPREMIVSMLQGEPKDGSSVGDDSGVSTHDDFVKQVAVFGKRVDANSNNANTDSPWHVIADVILTLNFDAAVDPNAKEVLKGEIGACLIKRGASSVTCVLVADYVIRNYFDELKRIHVTQTTVGDLIHQVSQSLTDSWPAIRNLQKLGVNVVAESSCLLDLDRRFIKPDALRQPSFTAVLVDKRNRLAQDKVMNIINGESGAGKTIGCIAVAIGDRKRSNSFDDDDDAAAAAQTAVRLSASPAKSTRSSCSNNNNNSFNSSFNNSKMLPSAQNGSCIVLDTRTLVPESADPRIMSLSKHVLLNPTNEGARQLRNASCAFQLLRAVAKALHLSGFTMTDPLHTPGIPKQWFEPQAFAEGTWPTVPDQDYLTPVLSQFKKIRNKFGKQFHGRLVLLLDEIGAASWLLRGLTAVWSEELCDFLKKMFNMSEDSSLIFLAAGSGSENFKPDSIGTQLCSFRLLTMNPQHFFAKTLLSYSRRGGTEEKKCFSRVLFDIMFRKKSPVLAQQQRNSKRANKNHDDDSDDPVDDDDDDNNNNNNNNNNIDAANNNNPAAVNLDDSTASNTAHVGANRYAFAEPDRLDATCVRYINLVTRNARCAAIAFEIIDQMFCSTSQAGLQQAESFEAKWTPAAVRAFLPSWALMVAARFAELNGFADLKKAERFNAVAQALLICITRHNKDLTTAQRDFLIVKCGIVQDSARWVQEGRYNENQYEILIRTEKTARYPALHKIINKQKSRYRMSESGVAMFLLDFGGCFAGSGSTVGSAQWDLFEQVVADHHVLCLALNFSQCGLDVRRLPDACRLFADKQVNIRRHASLEKLQRQLGKDAIEFRQDAVEWKERVRAGDGIVMINADRAPFADIVVLTPGVLFLTQCKHLRDTTPCGAEAEFTKMHSNPDTADVLDMLVECCATRNRKNAQQVRVVCSIFLRSENSPITGKYVPKAEVAKNGFICEEKYIYAFSNRRNCPAANGVSHPLLCTLYPVLQAQLTDATQMEQQKINPLDSRAVYPVLQHESTRTNANNANNNNAANQNNNMMMMMMNNNSNANNFGSGGISPSSRGRGRGGGGGAGRGRGTAQ